MDANDSTIFNDPQEALARQERLQEVADQIERTRHSRYRLSLARRLIRLTGFVVLFIALVFVLHDKMVIQQYELKMNEVAQLLRDYREANRLWPSVNEFLEMVDASRNLSETAIEYHPQLILDSSPPQTLLAHTPLCRQWVLPEKHLVIRVDFSLEWVTPAELDRLLTQRRQYYNQHSAEPAP